jgi:hypothetical protein
VEINGRRTDWGAAGPGVRLGGSGNVVARDRATERGVGFGRGPP